MRLNTDQPSRHPSPTTRATALAYLVFERPDLDKAESFLTDFGLRRAERYDDMLFLRGTDTSPFCYVVRRADKPGFCGMVSMPPAQKRIRSEKIAASRQASGTYPPSAFAKPATHPTPYHELVNATYFR